MGVHGLWELLAPVGRRVSVETLSGKKLAIDASIWMIQFMKAMRDERGEMVRNAHVLGFFRRICKLLYLRTKPVFVFDGGTPALKRRTVIARRRQRENAQAKIRKTAEKLLINHLKAMRLKELAADLERQRQENDVKGKRPIIQEPNDVQSTEKGNDDLGISYNQEELDAMLAASLAAEENEGLRADASTSDAGAPDDEGFVDEEEDTDEEMILPEMHGKVDPAILAALPPSMQLDLLVQMRERLMAENRQKYQKVKKAPARFSELQIQAYLKTVAFRREIDGVQKAAAGRGIGGVQTSRIASEANREFIFSSSFTGDKQALTSVGQERVGDDQSQPPCVSGSTDPVNSVPSTKRSGAADPVNSVPSTKRSGAADPVNSVLPTTRSGAAAAPAVAETGNPFHDDVETYLDERGRLRVSRVRALGIRMTRDLQRNLDLMKEIDQEKAGKIQGKNSESTNATNPVDVLDNLSNRFQHQEIIDNNNDEVDKSEEPVVTNGAPIEISFEDTLECEYDNDDDNMFARLVAGDPIMDFPADASASAEKSLHSESDCEWEEGVIKNKSTSCLFDGGMSDEREVEWEEGVIENKSTSCLFDGGKSDEREVELEGGFHDIQLKSSTCPDESRENVTKGALQEEADFEEAIRRSLEDTGVCRSKNDFHVDNVSEGAKEMVGEEGFQDIQLKSSACPDESLKTVTKGALQEKADFEEAIRISLEDTGGCRSMNDFHEDHVSEKAKGTVSEDADLVPFCERKEGPEVEASATDVSQPFGSTNTLEGNCSEAKSAAFIELGPEKSNLNPKLLNQDGGGSGGGETPVASEILPEEKGSSMTGKQPVETCSEGSNQHTGSLHDRLVDSGKADAQNIFRGDLDVHSCYTGKLRKIYADDSIPDVDGAKELAKEKIYDDCLTGEEEAMISSSLMNGNKELEIMKDHLEEEMLSLGKEREDLGSEQRKLERNAESVSSEMFAECQELLQMFGLPYIIAPMEAEAQCAFMELSNLVDGVVTDDSDAFLFGAQTVYKNIFDDRKYVETYLMKDVEDELGLDREKLIHMALLLGSDYTEGISGIGIVNAIEVVNAFPEKDGLREFRDWIESPDPTILGKLDVEAGGNSRRKGSKGSGNINGGSSSNAEVHSCDENVPQPLDDAERKKQIFMDKHRNVSKNWHIPSSFPSDAVISAYASPQVDKSTEPFAWGKPDLFVLRKLCWEKFGWNASKADELLQPVLKEYNKHETQLRLEAFYTFNERFAKIRSKRITKAVKGITGNRSSELMDETMPQKSGSKKKRKVKPSENEENSSGVGSTIPDGAGASNNNQDNNTEKPTGKQLKGQRTKEKTSRKNAEQCTSVDSHLITKKESGRCRGRGRGQPSGRGRNKKNSSSVDTETGNDDGGCSGSDEEMQFQRSEESRQVRRSGRPRKIVNYNVSDELDNCDNERESFLKEYAAPEEPSADQAAGGVNEQEGDEGNEGTPLLNETEQAYMMHKMSPSQTEDPVNLSKDYLQFGGGFCVDEDDEMEVDKHASSPTRETNPDESHLLDCANESNTLDITPRPSGRETDALNANDKRSDDYDVLDDIDNDSENCVPKSLRAMPNLRKKRRKT